MSSKFSLPWRRLFARGNSRLPRAVVRADAGRPRRPQRAEPDPRGRRPARVRRRPADVTTDAKTAPTGLCWLADGNLAAGPPGRVGEPGLRVVRRRRHQPGRVDDLADGGPLGCRHEPVRPREGLPGPQQLVAPGHAAPRQERHPHGAAAQPRLVRLRLRRQPDGPPVLRRVRRKPRGHRLHPAAPRSTWGTSNSFSRTTTGPRRGSRRDHCRRTSPSAAGSWGPTRTSTSSTPFPSSRRRRGPEPARRVGPAVPAPGRTTRTPATSSSRRPWG